MFKSTTALYKIVDFANAKSRSRKSSYVLLGLMLSMFAHASVQAANRFAEAKDFMRLSTPIVHDAADRIDVVEFFSLACSHCAELEPHLNKWASNRPNNVRFRRVPVPFYPAWIPVSKVFFVLESAGREDLMLKAFESIHGGGEQMKNEASFLVWAEKNQVNPALLKGMWDSFAVNVKLKRAESLTKQFSVQSVPAIFVDGKFMVQSTSEASKGTVAHRDVPAVLAELVEKAVAERRR
jgi:protein dithiol oxidoreductase (disulfide-forming)